MCVVSNLIRTTVTKQCAAVTPAPLYSSLVLSVKTLFATVLDTWEQGVSMQSKMHFSKRRDRKGFQLSDLEECAQEVRPVWFQVPCRASSRLSALKMDIWTERRGAFLSKCSSPLLIFYLFLFLSFSLPQQILFRLLWWNGLTLLLLHLVVCQHSVP